MLELLNDFLSPQIKKEVKKYEFQCCYFGGVWTENLGFLQGIFY